MFPISVYLNDFENQDCTTRAAYVTGYANSLGPTSIILGFVLLFVVFVFLLLLALYSDLHPCRSKDCFIYNDFLKGELHLSNK